MTTSAIAHRIIEDLSRMLGQDDCLNPSEEYLLARFVASHGHYKRLRSLEEYARRCAGLQGEPDKHRLFEWARKAGRCAEELLAKEEQC